MEGRLEIGEKEVKTGKETQHKTNVT